MKKNYWWNRIVFVSLILTMFFSLAPLFAAEEYSSYTKSPAGAIEPQHKYLPGTKKLDLDEVLTILHRIEQDIENPPVPIWEYKTVRVNYVALSNLERSKRYMYRPYLEEPPPQRH